ncbi:MAG: DNA polymerase III subunit chi [Candidimonas sp.]|jgi:DNA polymerase-3 subunit chi
MARVDFAFGAPDRLQMACEVAHKHYLAGRRILVYSQDARRLSQFDGMLWSVEPTSFVPHVRADDPLAAATPIWLVDASPAAWREKQAGADVWLLNLDDACPPNAHAFERILEIVSDDDADKQKARQRWRQYQADGHALRAHQVGKAQ